MRYCLYSAFIIPKKRAFVYYLSRGMKRLSIAIHGATWYTEQNKQKGCDGVEFEPIARIYNDFPTKFGLPRQSGMSEHLLSEIVMEHDFRQPEAFRGIGEFEYLWLIWLFEPMGKRGWSPTVRPPKLGGNKRVGVFATRSQRSSTSSPIFPLPTAFPAQRETATARRNRSMWRYRRR